METRDEFDLRTLWSNLDRAEAHIEALLRNGASMKDKRQVYKSIGIRLRAIRRAVVLMQQQQQQQEGGAA